MSLWEYKHITSGPHGFATPALLESYLNQLGKDEWEIISYQTLPSSPLAFNGVARRTTQRDWTLESAAAAAAKIEADKLRAEFAAKFQGQATGGASSADVDGADKEKPTSLAGEAAAPEDGLRRLRDTERDGDPDAPEEGDWDEWDNYDDDLPTFFEAIKPHLRKNHRGPGQSVGVTFLSKRWEQTEADLVHALQECGFVVPESEDTPPAYLEFEGDLYWLNLNNRHELFLNTREKPRPVFRVVPARPLDPADPANGVLAEEVAAEQAEKAKREAERIAREAEAAARRAEQEARRIAAQAVRDAQIAAAAAAKVAAQEARAAAVASAGASAGGGGEANGASAGGVDGVQAVQGGEPASGGGEAAAGYSQDEVIVMPPGSVPAEGEALLDEIRPQMRRNRRGPGYSGSTSYLARALKVTEAELVAGLGALGMPVPATAADKLVRTQIGEYVYWLNKDSRGGIWINGEEARAPKPAVAVAPAAVVPAADQAAEPVDAPACGAPAAPQVAVEEKASDVPDQSVVPASEVPEVPRVTEKPEVTAEGARGVGAPGSLLAAMRLLLKPNKRGSGVSGEVTYLARSLEKDTQDFLSVLTGLGFALGKTEEDKPSFVEHDGEIFWLNKNAKDGSVWLNAKASKAAVKKAAATTAPAKAKAKTTKKTAE